MFRHKSGLFAINWANERFIKGKNEDKAKWWLVNILNV